MSKLKDETIDKIVKALRNEFELREEDYDQWVLGVSCLEKEVGTQEFRVKVVVHTSESIYSDGMELTVYIVDGEVKLEEDFFEKTPDLMGSSVKDAINWLREYKIIYLQLLNPYEFNVYLERLKDIIGEYSFKTLAEYNLHSINGSNLLNLYQDLIQEMLLQRVEIQGKEVNTAEYELDIVVGDETYKLEPRSSFSREEVIEEIESVIIMNTIDN